MRIGGPFSQEDLREFKNSYSQVDTLFPPQDRYYFQSGADALAAILLQTIHTKTATLWIPRHFCENSISRTLKKFARAKGFKPKIIRYSNLEDIQSKPHAVVLLAYFNRFNPSLYPKYRRRFPVVIEDFVQAPFSIHLARSPYAFNSLRKFLPLAISVAYLPNKPQIDRPQENFLRAWETAQKFKHQFLCSLTRTDEKRFLVAATRAENLLQLDDKVRPALKRQLVLLEKIHLRKIVSIRQKNHILLSKLLKRKVFFLPGDHAYAMLVIPQRDSIRAQLMSRNIFTAVHWPDSRAKIRKYLLSLPIDQRYGTREMRFLAQQVLSLVGPKIKPQVLKELS